MLVWKRVADVTPGVESYKSTNGRYSINKLNAYIAYENGAHLDETDEGSGGSFWELWQAKHACQRHENNRLNGYVDSFCLMNAIEENRKSEAFEIPTKEEIDSIRHAITQVKVCAEFDRGDGVTTRGERFWCRVLEVADEGYYCIVDNDLVCTEDHGIGPRDRILITEKNIIEVKQLDYDESCDNFSMEARHLVNTVFGKYYSDNVQREITEFVERLHKSFQTLNQDLIFFLKRDYSKEDVLKIMTHTFQLVDNVRAEKVCESLDNLTKFLQSKGSA